MRDPIGFTLLATLGMAALTAGAIGLHRGRSVSIVEPLRLYRAEKPLHYWAIVGLQLTVAITCIVGAIRAV
jgi:hypothetical protein